MGRRAQVRDRAIAGRLARDPRAAHGRHHVRNRDARRMPPQHLLHLDLGIGLGRRAQVAAVDRQWFAGAAVVPSLRRREVQELGRTHEVGALQEIRREFDLAGLAVAAAAADDPDLVGSKPRGNPEPLAAGEFDEHPALVLVRKQVRVSSVGRLPVGLDQLVRRVSD